MVKVTLIGKGNVSSHLEKVFHKADEVNLINVLSSRGDAFEKALTDDSELCILTVSDDAISAIAKKFKSSKKLIVHTSGSVAIKALPKDIRRGVFYPLQTFTKDKYVDFKCIPICIEAEKKEDLELLLKLAKSISESVQEVSSEQRKSLHLAAVFVNNFTNHIYQIGSEICLENGVSFDILKPLISETAKKIDTLSPIEAQTGPAKRNDTATIKSQLEQLEKEKYKEIYQVLTESIQETHGQKL